MITVPVYRLELVREQNVALIAASKFEQRAQILHELLDRSPIEQMIVLYLDAGYNLIGAEKVGMGTTISVIVSMAEIFRGAIAASAVSIVLGHNHLDGVVTPSKPDWNMTKKALAMGELLNIFVEDHIIVGPGNKHLSMRDEMIKDLNHQDNHITGRMMSIMDSLPEADKKAMQTRLRQYGFNPDTLPRSKESVKDIPGAQAVVNLLQMDLKNNSFPG
jgi:hypothetical protein